MALLEINHAGFSYGETTIFKNIQFKVEPGEIYCIFGPNGCGKSTLLECVLGLLKLDEGEILIDGKNTARLKPSELARYAAYVPQLHEKTFPYKVLDFVLMGRAAHTKMLGSPGKADREIALNALDALRIADFRDRPYTQLSGGELQLVMLARALAQETPLIVLDEPTSHLDFKNDIAILETITRLALERNLAILMATHFPNQGFFFEYQDLPVEILLMGHDNKLIKGKPTEVFTEENMRVVFGMDSRVIACTTEEQKILRQIVSIRSQTSGQV